MLTTDPNHPELGSGTDTEMVAQNKVYLVLPEEERAKGYIRPFRLSYTHKKCNTVTTMNSDIAATYARNPKFYGATYCCNCQMHLPVSEFLWSGTNEEVGS